MIPKTLHYCWFTPKAKKWELTSCIKPWSLIHYVCLRSAIERTKPTDAFVYFDHEPSGPWWELTRSLVTPIKITAPQEIWGNPLSHPAHQADVVRLEKLMSRGGIYLDVDMFVHRSFDELLGHSTVLGQQAQADGSVRGLCNAVILAEAQSPFLARWYSAYRSFRSRGKDEYWDEHSVRIPNALSKRFPNEVTTLPSNAFFWPTFTRAGIATLFASNDRIDLSQTYATHLWENVAWEQYLEHLTPRRVRVVDTNFHFWARSMLAGLPDTYGRPSFTSRFMSSARALRRHIRSAMSASSRVEQSNAINSIN